MSDKSHVGMLTQLRLKNALDYDPTTGVFRWKISTARRVKVGDVAGYKAPRGYVAIKLDGKLYYAHRLAWLYTHGYMPATIDHVNCDRSDNRIDNLRCATITQNGRNQLKSSRNTSGVKGVSWDNNKQKWLAQVAHRRVNVFFKRFTHFEDAVAAVQQFRSKAHEEFTNHG